MVKQISQKDRIRKEYHIDDSLHCHLGDIHTQVIVDSYHHNNL